MMEELSEKSQQLKKLVVSYDYGAPSRDHQVLRDNEQARAVDSCREAMMRPFKRRGAATLRTQYQWQKGLKEAYEGLGEKYVNIVGGVGVGMMESPIINETSTNLAPSQKGGDS